MSLGLVFPNSGGYGSQSGAPVIYRIIQKPVTRTPTVEDTANALIAQILNSPKGEIIIEHFMRQKPGFWKPILASKWYSPCVKFKKIFGVELVDMFAPRLAGLGNIFKDIGDWFNSGGAEKLALQVQNTSQSIAQALNALRNKSTNIEQQMKVQDFQTSSFFGAQDFLSTYGIYIIAGLGLLLILKK